MKKRYILSVYFGFHDSCLTISDDQAVLLHLEAERYFRQKHIHITADQMSELITVALEYLSLSIDDISELLVAKWNNQFRNHEIKILGKIFTPIFTSHHDNHLGTMIPANFQDAIVICADGGSEDGTTKIYSKSGKSFHLLEDLDNTIMTGKFYGTITQMIVDPRFIKAHDTYPGKTMGLAAYGSFSSEFNYLIECNKETLNTLQIGGCEDINRLFEISFNYERIWEDQRRCDLAHTAQQYWQEIFLRKILEYTKKSNNIALVGGCALNILLNTLLAQSGAFKRIFVSPVSGDNGQSLGAILYRYPHLQCDYPFLGRGFGSSKPDSQLSRKLADDLMAHHLIAWYDGRSEIGARALGHRSFIGMADSLKLKIRLSERIKGREPYRPVAAIVPTSRISKYFEASYETPYMTYAPLIKKEYRKCLEAIVHADGTCRLQTINQRDHPIIYDALMILEKRKKEPVIMNTSLNIAGEPIVDTPAEAIATFRRSGADVLYINGKRYDH